MKKIFRDTPDGVTSKCFMRALTLAVKYVDPSKKSRI